MLNAVYTRSHSSPVTSNCEALIGPNLRGRLAGGAGVKVTIINETKHLEAGPLVADVEERLVGQKAPEVLLEYLPATLRHLNGERRVVGLWDVEP